MESWCWAWVQDQKIVRVMSSWLYVVNKQIQKLMLFLKYTRASKVFNEPLCYIHWVAISCFSFCRLSLAVPRCSMRKTMSSVPNLWLGKLCNDIPCFKWLEKVMINHWQWVSHRCYHEVAALVYSGVVAGDESPRADDNWAAASSGWFIPVQLWMDSLTTPRVRDPGYSDYHLRNGRQTTKFRLAPPGRW